ncbi:MAG: hypothetical protein IPK52_07505 [Chloroflexi bacterium]|nr:hypothetical protein [Chloroflexota bacterium]
MRTWIGIALVAVLALTVTAQPSPETVSIDAAEVINEVNPLVFGANFGPLNTVPLELKEEALAAGLTYLRFPGGRVGDLGDIPNFQIDLYMAVCKMMNCTPAISARQENGTPEKAAEMVRYVNVTKGYGVKYWSVGNEPDLWDGYTPERHSAEWRVFAEAMLAVDPDILFVGPDISQFTGVEGDSQQRAHDFLREFLRVNGDLVDIVSVHRYPFGATAATVEGLQADASGWEQLIDNLHQFAADELGRSVPVAITEVNSHWSAIQAGDATPDSYAAALWWADVFGQMLEGDLAIVAYFGLQSSDRLGGHGLLGAYEVRPTYYVYLMYKQFGTRMLAANTESDVRVYAARREDGAVTILLVNWATQARFLNIDIDGLSVADSEAQITDFTENGGVVTSTELLDDDFLQTLEPRSIRLLVLPARP